MSDNWSRILVLLLYLFGGVGLLNAISNFSASGIFGSLLIIGLAKIMADRNKSLSNNPAKSISAKPFLNAKPLEIDASFIIKLAKRLGGSISAERLSTESRLSLDEAKKKLEALHQQGLLDIDIEEVSATGKIIYRVV